MKAHPILFSGPMVRALLDGTKTQTRRILKSQPLSDNIRGPVVYTPVALRRGEEVEGIPVFGVYDDTGEWGLKCPYGQPGDRLWVKEMWNSFGDSSTITPPVPHSCQIRYAADGKTEWRPVPDGARGVFPASSKGRPSIHMPRWASRITLEITGIRVERLNSINEEDCLAEGVTGWTCGDWQITAKEAYCLLWNKINGMGAWDLNPWVWVVEFRVVAPGGVVGAGGTPALPA